MHIVVVALTVVVGLVSAKYSKDQDLINAFVYSIPRDQRYPIDISLNEPVSDKVKLENLEKLAETDAQKKAYLNAKPALLKKLAVASKAATQLSDSLKASLALYRDAVIKERQAFASTTEQEEAKLDAIVFPINADKNGEAVALQKAQARARAAAAKAKASSSTAKPTVKN